MNQILTAPEISTWILSGQVKEDEPVRNLRIERNYVTVGRKSNSDLTIPCPSVSGSHAELSVEGEYLYVSDLSSTNGTFLNGVRIYDRCRVSHGDLLQFANGLSSPT